VIAGVSRAAMAVRPAGEGGTVAEPGLGTPGVAPTSPDSALSPAEFTAVTA